MREANRRPSDSETNNLPTVLKRLDINWFLIKFLCRHADSDAADEQREEPRHVAQGHFGRPGQAREWHQEPGARRRRTHQGHNSAAHAHWQRAHPRHRHPVSGALSLLLNQSENFDLIVPKKSNLKHQHSQSLDP